MWAIEHTSLRTSHRNQEWTRSNRAKAQQVYRHGHQRTRDVSILQSPKMACSGSIQTLHQKNFIFSFSFSYIIYFTQKKKKKNSQFLFRLVRGLSIIFVLLVLILKHLPRAARDEKVKENASGDHHAPGGTMWEPDRDGVLEAALPRTWHQQGWHSRRFRYSGPFSSHFHF